MKVDNGSKQNNAESMMSEQGSCRRQEKEVLESVSCRGTIPRRGRDRAIHREKKKVKGCETSELSGRSLSDSDLVYCWELSIKEAKKALSLGKSLGVQIDGDEEEAVRELARLDLSEH
ncbi:hypothetical protein V6N11_070459 [Hibiscus sabdariffa]|uniref:Uncharacterized protein n=1 Tax=Hibiscus sabdariffa TaxID=183260 RepID=A0ABR2QF25_9ROSI